MVAMLDSVFTMPPVYDESYYGQVIHEIREMQIMNMGQYAHGNQPIQHMPYLYQYTAQPHKTAYWVRQIMNRLYKATPDGYCGDEDNGQTSAWYVFSAMGFYPVCPGSNEYVLGTPYFKSMSILLENGRQIKIEAPANSPEFMYTKNIQFNGRPISRAVAHEELTKGGRFFFEMSKQIPATMDISNVKLPYSFSVHEQANK
jgi:predicted alpha-1,2-mannosidase